MQYLEMLPLSYLPNDFCIGTYYSKDLDSDENFPYDPYTGFILDIKGGDEESIQHAVELLAFCLTGFDAVAVVPSHCVQQAASSGIRRVATRSSQQTKTVDATACLRRHISIQKRTDEGSDRSESEHLKSINLHHPYLLKGKRVLLLDDVRTTGNSLKACQLILEQACPTAIHPVAFAQSIGDSGCDPAESYTHIDIDIQDTCRQQVEAYYELASEDEVPNPSYLECIEAIEIHADAARQALDCLQAFANF